MSLQKGNHWQVIYLIFPFFFRHIYFSLKVDGLAVLHVYEYGRGAVAKNIDIKIEFIFRAPCREFNFAVPFLSQSSL